MAIEYWMENGKYTFDGYDTFDTFEEMKTDYEWQVKWTEGKAHKENGVWVND